MSSIRRPRVKVQANLGNKRKPAGSTAVDEKDTTFKCPLTTPSNNNNNNDIPSNNILQKDMIEGNSTQTPTSSRKRRTSSCSSAVEDSLDLKPPAVSYKAKSDLHIHIPPRVRTESSSSSHSVKEPRIRTESGSSRIRTESVSSSSAFSETPSRKSKMIRDVSNKDRSELTMFDLIYNYTPTANPMVKSEPQSAPPIKTEKPPVPPKVATPPPTDEPILVPQLKIGLNGEVIIDEQSLEIQTTAEKEAKKILSNSSCIFMDEFTGSNGFYRKQKRTKEWPEAETIKFYKCLHTVGTDFSLMISLFPNRSRRDLKLKFKKEEKVNENLIKKALLYPKTFDITELEKVLEADEEEKRKREEEWNELKKKKAASKRSGKRKSKQGKDLSEGDNAYKNEGLLTQNIKKKIKVEGRKEKVPLEELILPVEEDTQSSVMEVDVSALKREITTFKKEQSTEDEEEEDLGGSLYSPTNEKENLPHDMNVKIDNEIRISETKKNIIENSVKTSDQNKREEVVKSPVLPEEEFDTQSSVMDVDPSDLKMEKICKNEIDLPLNEGEELLGEFVPDDSLTTTDEGVEGEEYMEEEEGESQENQSFDNEDDDTQSTFMDIDCLQGGAIILKNVPEEKMVEEKVESILQNDQEMEEEEEADESQTEVENLTDMTPEEIIALVANGSLAVVTSESEEGETVYEVYKMCPSSGELSENPLNLHPEIINVIKMVV